jgi:hypothetical protein
VLDRLFIVASFILMLTSHKRYRKIAFVLFLWLLISELAYNNLLLDFRSNNHWAIYQIYNFINSATITLLTTLKSHMLPIYLLAANVLLNIAVSFYFISDNIPVSVYNSYSYIACMIVLLALLYMRGLHYGDRLKQRENDNSSIVSMLFFSRHGRNKQFLSRNFL